GVPRPTGQGPESGPSGISPAGSRSPQAVGAPSRPPRAAHSHSASLGSRQRRPLHSESQSAQATASNQVTPTTGSSRAETAGSFPHGGAGGRPAARNGAYWARLTGVRAGAKAPTRTVCTGRSSGRPPAEPIAKLPAGTSTTSGQAAVRAAARADPLLMARPAD